MSDEWKKPRPVEGEMIEYLERLQHAHEVVQEREGRLRWRETVRDMETANTLALVKGLLSDALLSPPSGERPMPHPFGIEVAPNDEWVLTMDEAAFAALASVLVAPTEPYQIGTLDDGCPVFVHPFMGGPEPGHETRQSATCAGHEHEKCGEAEQEMGCECPCHDLAECDDED